MLNQLNNVKVSKVSFVGRAAVRDPDQPDQPRRFCLFKSEDAPNHERTDDMLTELEKRAIGEKGAKPAGSNGLLTVAQIEDKQSTIAPLLGELHDDIHRMRRAGTVAPEILARHEKAHANLAEAYQGLDAQRGLAERHAPLVKAEDSLIAKVDVALRKADPGLSPLESLKMAMRSDPDGYFAQSGTSRPAPATGQLAKAEADRDADEASVARRAAQLEKGGLSPTAAYAQALRESGIYDGRAAAA